MITSRGKCAPTPTLEKTKSSPINIIEKIHNNLYFNFSGRNANNKMVSVVKTVMACPDGKLEKPVAALPTITKLLLSKICAGLGTKNIFFSVQEKRRDTSEADSNDSHILGAYTTKSIKKDKKIEASPNWVRLYSMFGYCPR